MYLTTFVVKGIGSFPLDMLRYDSCFPMSSSDVAAMSEMEHGGREVKLGQYHAAKEPSITDGRCASFLWTVQSRSTRKV